MQANGNPRTHASTRARAREREGAGKRRLAAAKEEREERRVAAKATNASFVAPSATRTRMDAVTMSSPTAASKFGERKRMRSVRDRCRTRILQDKVDLWRSLESQARKSSAAHAGSKSHKLPAEDFLHVLAQHGLRLQEQDANLVVSKFADFRGFVDFGKFYRMLDVLPPEDHVDPSLTRDRLPQPYRMLVKILEDHVIEAAWEQITLRNMPKSARVAQSQSLSGNSASRASLATSTKSESQANLENASDADAAAAAAAANEQARRAMNQTDAAVKQQLETLRLMKSKPRAMRQCKPGATVAVPNLSARTFSSGHSFSCYGTEDGHVVVIGEGGQVSSYAAEAFSGPVAAIACAPWGVSGLVIVAFHRPRGSREPGSDPGAADDGAEHEVDEASLAARELGWASGPTTAQLLVLDPTLGSLSCVGAATELDEEIETAWVDASAWSETSVLRCACVVSDKSAHEDEHSLSDEEEMSAPIPRKLLFFDVSYERPSIDADVPVLESALAEDAASETDGSASNTDVRWSLARSAMPLPLADGPARGYFCKSRHFFTLYVRGCNEVHEHRWSSSKSIVTWMSSGILCDAQHMSANGVELCAFGLRDGCITVWNVWASVVRAILRHHQSPTTSIMFMMPNEDPEGSSVNSPQILAGCGDGRLRLFQISSDAPSSAAIRPRGGERGALFADAAFAEALTGGSFLAEFEDAATDDEASAVGVSAICGLRQVPTTPLLLVKTRCDLRLYDMEAGAQIGVLEPVSGRWEGAEGSNEMTAGFAQQDVVVLSNDTITVFPALLYVAACYPSIARAIKFTDPLQPLTASAKRRLAFEAVKLLNATTAEQRCDPEKDLASRGAPQFASTMGLVSLNSASLSPSQHTITESSTESKSKGASAGPTVPAAPTPPGGGKAAGAFTFSNMGLLASKLRARKMQASKNVMNPTRLSESLIRTLPRDKMNEFEDRRVETRAEREKHLSSTMERWGSISHVAR